MATSTTSTTGTTVTASGTASTYSTSAITSSANYTIPNDLTSNGAGDLYASLVNADGTTGAVAKTFKNFMISLTPSIASDDEEFTTGTDSNITMTSTETKSYTLTVNGFNPEFHALITGNEIEYNNAKALNTHVADAKEASGAITIVLGTDDPTPTTNAENTLEFFVSDVVGGHSLVRTTDSSALDYTTFMYDETTKTFTFSEAYKDMSMSIAYWYDNQTAICITPPDIVTRPELRFVAKSFMTSVTKQEKYELVRIVTRGKLTGDYGDIISQKSFENQISYTIETQSTLDGVKKWSETIYPVK